MVGFENGRGQDWYRLSRMSVGLCIAAYQVGGLPISTTGSSPSTFSTLVLYS